MLTTVGAAGSWISDKNEFHSDRSGNQLVPTLKCQLRKESSGITISPLSMCACRPPWKRKALAGDSPGPSCPALTSFAQSNPCLGSDNTPLKQIVCLTW